VTTAAATRYRVVADRPPAPDAEPATATLEDAYLALLHADSQPVGRAS
jgi:hypothetical protein